jgi:hypothetical protein
MGVEPTEDICMPPNGFEVREAHRDLYTPERGNFLYQIAGKMPCRASAARGVIHITAQPGSNL